MDRVDNKIDLDRETKRMNQRNEFEYRILNSVFRLRPAKESSLFSPVCPAMRRVLRHRTGPGQPRAPPRSAARSSHDALDRALAEGARGREDIIAEELRLAAQTLGRLTGRVDVEDILDVIFRDFCIGK